MDRLLWTGITITAPILLGCLIVGVIVSILQVVTQVQEQTLSYVPKLIAAALILLTLGGWMIHRIAEFAITTIRLIPAMG